MYLYFQVIVNIGQLLEQSYTNLGIIYFFFRFYDYAFYIAIKFSHIISLFAFNSTVEI